VRRTVESQRSARVAQSFVMKGYPESGIDLVPDQVLGLSESNRRSQCVLWRLLPNSDHSLSGYGVVVSFTIAAGGNKFQTSTYRGSILLCPLLWESDRHRST
jgi:hypothetical protein